MLTNFLAAKYTRQQNCALNIEATEVLLGSLIFLKAVANISPVVQKP